MGAAGRRNLPTSEELATWRAHVETFDIVRARIESRLHQDSKLSSGDYRVLLALSEADGSTVRSSELAAHIEWERSRLSGHLGRMEKRGLVRREPCAEDARGSRVLLTAEGARAFRASTVPHLQAIKEIFVDAFTPRQLADLDETAAAVRRHLDLDSPRPRSSDVPNSPTGETS
ncbi:MarR family transcriptional regulator [Isoptericola halotolerans]|uniref:DNA-binding MarR family transcriptional regulator n=1 Tax=Isoptericola halotolerans TaxID=300560 RepID=A0ABX1ZYU9_9MICO|nr:MarR family transcriptional regulator [Isoptericola halotolerans]NOV95646.1 DNA-binding MarR family transcriptional regulator [Isoptericola halotolerans]